MKINWEIEPKEIDAIQNFIQKNSGPFVQARRSRNVERENVVINKNTVLKSIAMCLVTSQQRSGPDTPVARFLRLEPFPFTYSQLKAKDDVHGYVLAVLTQNGLKRYINRIANFYSSNFDKLERQNWALIKVLNDLLLHPANKENERRIARKIKKDLKGLGPKQSRNFLQALGLTQFEIPIDSRITDWLKAREFPVPLSSTALQDEKYYEFVSDGIGFLCAQTGILPCLLDAAIFSSVDQGKWTKENVVF